MALYFECQINKKRRDCCFGDFVHWVILRMQKERNPQIQGIL